VSARDQHAAGIPLGAWRLGGGPTCGIHGEPTDGGRCGSCDQLAYDQAEAERERMEDEAAERADYDAGRAEDYGRPW
jgi:hypothetical protein